MKLVLREATLADSAMIAELSGQLGYKSSTESTTNRLIQLFNNKGHCVYVVIDDKTVVGWIHGFHSLTVEYDPCVEIGGLVIDINHRRKGIGQMLVNEVIAWSRSIGMNRIRVRSNTIRNDAHSFYLGIGFIQIKEQKVFDLLLK